MKLQLSNFRTKRPHVGIVAEVDTFGEEPLRQAAAWPAAPGPALKYAVIAAASIGSTAPLIFGDLIKQASGSWDQSYDHGLD